MIKFNITLFLIEKSAYYTTIVHRNGHMNLTLYFI